LTVFVSLGLASICFLGQCHPALVGAATPPGNYQLRQRIVMSPGYGGDVLSFQEGDSTILAIHRIWLESPREHRPEKLASTQAARRRGVTDGCINVAANVYDMLVDCCADAQLVVE